MSPFSRRQSNALDRYFETHQSFSLRQLAREILPILLYLGVDKLLQCIFLKSTLVFQTVLFQNTSPVIFTFKINYKDGSCRPVVTSIISWPFFLKTVCILVNFNYSEEEHAKLALFSFLWMNGRKRHYFRSFTAWKVSKYGVYSGPYFPAFGLNTERYVFLGIRSECG